MVELDPTDFQLHVKHVVPSSVWILPLRLEGRADVDTQGGVEEEEETKACSCWKGGGVRTEERLTLGLSCTFRQAHYLFSYQDRYQDCA